MPHLYEKVTPSMASSPSKDAEWKPEHEDNENSFDVMKVSGSFMAVGGKKPQTPHCLTSGTRGLLLSIAHGNPKNREALIGFPWRWVWSSALVFGGLAVILSLLP